MSLASDVVASVRATLQDYDVDRYTDADILKQVNGARRALAVARPDVYSDVIIHPLVAGARQPVPADCNDFYELQMNRGVGDAPGAPISVIEREFLDKYQPGWLAATPGTTEHFAFDERTPGFFYVSPPAVAGAKVDLAYAKIPADVVLGATLNAQEGLMQDTLADYAVARLLLGDAESPANTQRGLLHLQLFASATGSDLKALLRSSPNVANQGGSQNGQ